MSLALAARMGSLGTETAFEVLARAKALEAQGGDAAVAIGGHARRIVGRAEAAVVTGIDARGLSAPAAEEAVAHAPAREGVRFDHPGRAIGRVHAKPSGVREG